MLRYLVVLLGLVPQVLCYSSGAPAGACGSLLPGHGASPQVGESPFTISGPTQAKVDSDIELILHGNGNTFKGFIIRGYEDNVGSTGQFREGQDVRTLSCDEQNDSASHDSPSDKSKVTITWKAPSYPTNVRFNSTIVINFSTIYMNIATYIEVVPIQESVGGTLDATGDDRVKEICEELNFYTGCAAGDTVYMEGRCTAANNPIKGSKDSGERSNCNAPNTCWIPVVCPNPCFISKHVCDYCDGTDEEAEAEALAFTKKARGNPPTNLTMNTVFYIPGDEQKRFKLVGTKCTMIPHSITFHCTLGEDGKWNQCKKRGVCGSESDLAYVGHLYKETIKGKDCGQV